eukprot:10423956-Alexandrium_andersonii.AAC.1
MQRHRTSEVHAPALELPVTVVPPPASRSGRPQALRRLAIASRASSRALPRRISVGRRCMIGGPGLRSFARGPLVQTERVPLEPIGP